jgi:acetyl-CoA carboxylase biotin carboxylase subunit
MLNKVLVANRGEIAVRIIRACHDLGIQAVAAFSEADQNALAVRLADEAVCIGPAVAARSYLNKEALISAAHITGCDAIHPGYGFLAENPDFAALCREHHVTFVGPQADTIRTMVHKLSARRAMQAAGVPVVPGSDESLTTTDKAIKIAKQVGFPVILKPACGGGGRGLRVFFNERELAQGFPTVRAESEAAFGSSEVLLEQYLPHVRHIEVQILADNHGHIIHLGERDCSVQRRHQKLVEEAPVPDIGAELRQRLREAALTAAQAVGYHNVGTLEFLVDSEGHYFFLEMNARIQVEHAVTELVTGIDLVRWQLLIAGGEHLTLSQHNVTLHGHAIECRINAEDPDRDFLPVTGVVEFFLPPGGPGVRVDTHLYSGYEPPRSYGPLLAKVIAWGDTRTEAIDRMRRALRECTIVGLKTTIPFQLAMLDDPVFRAGSISTRYVAEMIDRWRSAA